MWVWVRVNGGEVNIRGAHQRSINSLCVECVCGCGLGLGLMEGKSISEGPTRGVLTASVWSVCVGVCVVSF